jgi:hypothetical protein
MASSQRSCGDKAEDRWVNATGYIGPCHPNFVVFFVLGHNGSLVINFPINRTPTIGGEVSNSAIPLSPPSHSSFLRGVGVLHGVREERRASERSLQFSKEWKDVIAISTPCRFLGHNQRPGVQDPDSNPRTFH